jgi:hypothetical protein
MFKLKYQEYFRLSRIKSIPSLKKIYGLLQTDKLDDVLSVAESDIKDTVMADVQKLFDYLENFKGLIKEDSDYLLAKYKVEKGFVSKETIMSILSDLKGNPFTTYIMWVIKENRDVNDMFNILPKVPAFEKMYKYYNSRYNIEIDEWDSK